MAKCADVSLTRQRDFSSCILKQNMIFFFQTLKWFLCLNLPRYVSNVFANHRYVRCWHLFWTWHITSHDMRISWLPDGGDGAGVITSHEAAGECKVATTRDVVCSFFPSANSPVSSHPAPRCPAGTPSHCSHHQTFPAHLRTCFQFPLISLAVYCVYTSLFPCLLTCWLFRLCFAGLTLPARPFWTRFPASSPCLTAKKGEVLPQTAWFSETLHC